MFPPPTQTGRRWRAAHTEPAPPSKGPDGRTLSADDNRPGLNIHALAPEAAYPPLRAQATGSAVVTWCRAPGGERPPGAARSLSVRGNPPAVPTGERSEPAGRPATSQLLRFYRPLAYPPIELLAGLD